MSSRKSKGTLGAPTTITSIPLTDANPDPSIGDLVREASVQVSTLVRAEVALAKVELVRELKKAAVGSLFFILALIIGLMSTIYLFFFFAALLHIWLPWWASAGIMFLAMVFLSLIALGLGVWRVMKIRAPEKTISTLKKVPEVLPTMPGHDKTADGVASGVADYESTSFTAPLQS